MIHLQTAGSVDVTALTVQTKEAFFLNGGMSALIESLAMVSHIVMKAILYSLPRHGSEPYAKPIAVM